MVRVVAREHPDEVDMVFCNENDSTLYDGCQCDFPHFCHCVNPVNGVIDPSRQQISLGDGEEREDVCRKLLCDYSSFTGNPTRQPSKYPTIPTLLPTSIPSLSPSEEPSNLPSRSPSKTPSDKPSTIPSKNPSFPQRNSQPILQLCRHLFPQTTLP